MLNKIVRSVNKYNLDNNLPDDTPELVSILRKHFVDEAINEMIDSNQFIIVESKYFIKYETGTHIPIPVNAEYARGMILVAENYLKHNSWEY